ncbi:hypothetical protein D6774_00160 [Candidatus Woesearchaeota archaeon]|nr:MAG: hypothetical protein D6774_00160 [Candidatus Woesearchaeota archaeon]
MIAPLIITLLIGFFIYGFDKLSPYFEHAHIRFISFSTGLFVTYLFLSMFPTMLRGREFLGNGVLFIFFWGFVVFHIAEKYVYQHSSSLRRRRSRLVRLRTLGFFVNHIILGIAVVFFFQTGQILLGYISFLPIIFHLMSSTLIVEHLHHKVRSNPLTHLLSYMSLFFGALIATLFRIPLEIYYGVFAFVVGILFYIIVRDTIPPYREGDSIYFLCGVVTYIILLLIEQFFTL